MAENADNKTLEPLNEENTDFKPITTQEQLNKIIEEIKKEHGNVVAEVL